MRAYRAKIMKKDRERLSRNRLIQTTRPPEIETVDVRSPDFTPSYLRRLSMKNRSFKSTSQVAFRKTE